MLGNLGKKCWSMALFFLIFWGTGVAVAMQPYENPDFEVITHRNYYDPFSFTNLGKSLSAAACFYMILNYYDDQQIFKDVNGQNDIALDEVVDDEISESSQVWQYLSNGECDPDTQVIGLKNAAQYLFVEGENGFTPYYSVQFNSEMTFLNDPEGIAERENRLEYIATNYLENNFPVILRMKPRYIWQPSFYIVLLGYDREEGIIYYANPRTGEKIETVTYDKFINSYFYQPGQYFRTRWDGRWMGFTHRNILPGDYRFSLTLDGYDRYYLLHVPEQCTGEDPVPLVLDFHGYLQNGQVQKDISGFLEKSDAEGFIVAYPEGISMMNTNQLRSWNADRVGWQSIISWSSFVGVDDVECAVQITENIKTQCNIDPSRIYLTGISQGGAMASLCAHERGDIFAAVAIVSAYLLVEPAEWSPVRPMSYVNFHGYEDEIVSYYGGLIVTPIEETTERWAQVVGCDINRPDVYVLRNPGIGSELEKITTYTHPNTDTIEVKMYSLHGTHTLYTNCDAYPDNFIADEAWAFLRRFSLPE